MNRVTTSTNYPVIKKAFISGQRGVKLEGASRTGKSWDISVFICEYLESYKAKEILVYRDYLSTLKKTTYKTLKKVWRLFGNDMGHFNKTASPIEYNSNQITFIGSNDDPMSSFGNECDLLWGNEMMSVGKDAADQFEQRCNRFVIYDYNPSDMNHWIYALENDPRWTTHHTTIFQNPYAPKEAKEKILSYEPWMPGTYEHDRNGVYYKGNPITDENQPPRHEANCRNGSADRVKWLVYGLGVKAVSEQTIYPYWSECDEIPKEYDLRLYGLDFGFTNSSTTLVELTLIKNSIYLREMLYGKQYGAAKINEEVGHLLDPDCYVVADPENRQMINDLRQVYHFNIINAIKGPGSVRQGIAKIQENRIFVHKDSHNIKREIKNYRWAKDKLTGTILNEPIKEDDHAMDAFRYAYTRFRI